MKPTNDQMLQWVEEADDDACLALGADHPNREDQAAINLCHRVWDEAIEAAKKECENADQEYEPYTGVPRALNYTCADAIDKLKERSE